MRTTSSGPSGLDAAILAARRGWFGVLYLLSRESKASTAGFVVTVISDLIQFSVFPLITISQLLPGSMFTGLSTALSVTILDVDTLFALADAGASSGRAVMFWAALAVVVMFLGLLGYVIGVLLSEGRQSAIVLRALAVAASGLTTVGFLPAVSLLLSVFHACPSVNALGVACRGDGHWVLISVVVIVLAVFSAVSTFFASVYIDTDLTSSALGAKVTGRVDAAMLVLKLILVTCFTTLDLPPVVQAVLAGVAALNWFGGTVFVQPFVQPMANSLAAAAAALNLWLVLVAFTLLALPGSSAGAFVLIGLVCAPVLGAMTNGTYRNAVAASSFASLRSALQADIWARSRVVLAQSMASADGPLRSRSARAGGASAANRRRTHAGRRASVTAHDSVDAGTAAAGLSQGQRGRRGRPGMVRKASARPTAGAGGLPRVSSASRHVRVQVIDDGGAGDESDSRHIEPVTTSALLPGVSSESLLSQAGMAYDEMLKTWPKSAATYASGSIFHRAYGSTVSSELTILAMARKQVGGAWDVAFLSYQRTRQLQERTGSGLSAVDRILFEEAWSAAVEDAIKCFSIQSRLYGVAVEAVPDVGSMGRLNSELFRARTSAEAKFQSMLSINPESIMALRAYSRFCDEVLGDPDRAAELRNKASRIEDKHAKTNVRSLDAVTVGASDEALSVMDEMNAVVTMTGDLRRYGEITDVNLAGARLFGRARSDLIGQSVSALFPEPLGLFYDAAILSYLSPHDQSESFARGTHVSVVQSAGGFLTPVRISLQEGAGSELDVTPCLSMVLQRAPTKRRVFIVGDAEAGFPVLAMDAESMALLGDAASGEDMDGAGSDFDDVGSSAESDTGLGGGGGDAFARGAIWEAGVGGVSEMAALELPLVRWVPDLSQLASAAMASGSGAQADLLVRGTMYNEDDEDDGEAFGAIVEDSAMARTANLAAPNAGDLPPVISGPGAPGPGRAHPDLVSSMSGGSAHMVVQEQARTKSGRLRPPRGLRLRFTAQALHGTVLDAKRPPAGPLPSHWLVTWEAPKQRHAPVPASVARSLSRAREKAIGAGSGGGGGKTPKAVGGRGRRGSMAGTPGQSAPAAKAAKGGRRSSASREHRRQPSTQGGSEAGGSQRAGMLPDSCEEDGAIAGGAKLPLLQTSLPRARPDQQSHAAPHGDAGSMASAIATAQGLTRKIVDGALTKPDPLIRGVTLIVMASLAAVVLFAAALAIVLPLVNDGARNLLRAADMSQRRAYNSRVSMGKWYQLISVSGGFTVVDDWESLTANLTTSVTRYESAHRELLGVTQQVQGALFQYEQHRGWEVCTSSSALYGCDTTELMSASDFVEFTIFHLRQVAALQPNQLSQTDPNDPLVVLRWHESLLILVPNVDLIKLALDRAASIAARELADGLSASLRTMTVVLVVVAVVTFSVATLGTTYFVARFGHVRSRILSALVQVPRRLLKRIARQTEQAQSAFSTAIGADSGDEGQPLDDVEGSPRGSTRNLLALSAHALADVAKQPRAGRSDPPRDGVPARVRSTAPVHPAQGARFVSMGTTTTDSKGRCGGCLGRKSPARKRTTDSSCFVLRASCNITAPLALIAVWVAVILWLVNAMFASVVVNAARSEQLHVYEGAAAALRGRIEVALLVPGPGRVEALVACRTNSTLALRSIGALLNGADTTGFGVGLPALAESSELEAQKLYQIIVHDTCSALPAASWEKGQCVAMHRQYGLKGLHSFTTAMLDDGLQARRAFSEDDPADPRDLLALLADGTLMTLAPALIRYSAKSAMSEVVVSRVVNLTADAADAEFDDTWSQLQLVLSLFSVAFILVIWLWALPAVRQLVATRAALLTLLRSLPEEAVLTTPAVHGVVGNLAVLFGMAQAGRAMQSLVKNADAKARADYRASSGQNSRFAMSVSGTHHRLASRLLLPTDGDKSLRSRAGSDEGSVWTTGAAAKLSPAPTVSPSARQHTGMTTTLVDATGAGGDGAMPSALHGTPSSPGLAPSPRIAGPADSKAVA